MLERLISEGIAGYFEEILNTYWFSFPLFTLVQMKPAQKNITFVCAALCTDGVCKKNQKQTKTKKGNNEIPIPVFLSFVHNYGMDERVMSSADVHCFCPS